MRRPSSYFGTRSSTGHIRPAIDKGIPAHRDTREPTAGHGHHGAELGPGPAPWCRKASPSSSSQPKMLMATGFLRQMFEI